MKKRNIIYALCLGLVSLASCSNEDDHLGLDKSQFVEPILTQVLTEQNFVVEETNMPEAIGEWMWTKANFGIDSPIKYEIEADTLADFSTAKVLTSPAGFSMVITKRDVNNAAMLFSRDVKSQTVYFRLRATLGTSSVGDVLYSKGESVTFTSYYVMAIPAKMYMTGDDFGDWNWNSEKVVELTPMNSYLGGFWTIQYLQAGKELRWAPKKDRAEEFGRIKNPNAGGVAVFNNDKASVTTDGLYMIYFDIARETMIIEPAMIYGTGNVFGGWGNQNFPFTLTADNKFTITVPTIDGTIPMRIFTTSSIAIDAGGNALDWWKSEFIVMGGVISYRGTGGDLADVKVTSGQVVTVDFVTGTGSIK